ncbi:MAG: hypothetical protein ACRDTF_22030 [Pseudonocardiaceae bacterium]
MHLLAADELLTEVTYLALCGERLYGSNLLSVQDNVGAAECQHAAEAETAVRSPRWISMRLSPLSRQSSEA